MLRLMTLISIATLLITVPSILPAESEEGNDGDRITALIEQLGEKSFLMREQAGKKLAEIGRPAIKYLRDTAASSEDSEIRYRCNEIIQAISRAAGDTELGKWAGKWKCGDQLLIIQRDYWWWGPADNPSPEQFERNRIEIVELTDEFVVADLIVEIGHFQGQTCKAIFKLDGDTLYYCGSYKARPTGFEDGSGYTVPWKRVKDPSSIKILR